MDTRQLALWISLGRLRGICRGCSVRSGLPAHGRRISGGPIPLQNIPAILVFAMLGNLLEEALFRGYVYGQLAQKMAPIKAGIASGVVFAFCHVFLGHYGDGHWLSPPGFHVVGRHDCRWCRGEGWSNPGDPDARRSNLRAFVWPDMTAFATLSSRPLTRVEFRQSFARSRLHVELGFVACLVTPEDRRRI